MWILSRHVSLAYSLNLTSQNTEKTGDRWFREYVDIPAGDYVIGFEAIATSAEQNPGIALDDVQLLAGECQIQGQSSLFIASLGRNIQMQKA